MSYNCSLQLFTFIKYFYLIVLLTLRKDSCISFNMSMNVYSRTCYGISLSLSLTLMRFPPARELSGEYRSRTGDLLRARQAL